VNPKVAVVVLVVIVMIFVVAVSTGAFHSSNTASGGWIDNIKSALVKPENIDITKLSGPCRQGNHLTLTAGATCVLTIGESGVGVRRLNLTIQGAAIAHVVVNESNGIVGYDGTIPNDKGNQAQIDVYQKGAKITVQCVAGPCVLI
jgi:hypothetical protein